MCFCRSAPVQLSSNLRSFSTGYRLFPVWVRYSNAIMYVILVCRDDLNVLYSRCVCVCVCRRWMAPFWKMHYCSIVYEIWVFTILAKLLLKVPFQVTDDRFSLKLDYCATCCDHNHVSINTIKRSVYTYNHLRCTPNLLVMTGKLIHFAHCWTSIAIHEYEAKVRAAAGWDRTSWRDEQDLYWIFCLQYRMIQFLTFNVNVPISPAS